MNAQAEAPPAHVRPGDGLKGFPSGAFGRQESALSFAAALGSLVIGRRLSDRGRTALAVTFVAPYLVALDVPNV